MMRLALFLALFLSFAAGSGPSAAADVEPRFYILERFPSANRPMLVWKDNLYVRIGYAMPRAGMIRISGVRADGGSGGADGGGTRVQAGHGMIVGWLSYRGLARITAIDVIVDADRDNGRPRFVQRLPLKATWAEGVPSNDQLPRWVDAFLESERREADQPRESGASSWSVVLGIVLFHSVPAYIVLQVFLLREYESGWRMAAGLPLLVSVPALVIVFGLGALTGNVGLLPLVLIFGAPFLLAYLFLLMCARIVWEDYLQPDQT